MREDHIEVRRTARYHTLGPEDAGVAEVWIALHGYRQLARRFLRRFQPLDDGTRLVVAPEALSRFYVDPGGGRHGPDSLVGATWMTREDRLREIADYVGYLDALAGRVFAAVDRETVRFTLLGFSQGLHTAARWATLGEWPPDRLVLWGDFLPPDVDLEGAAARWSGVDVVFVFGDRDRRRGARLAEEQERRLAAAGIEHRTVEYEGGHDIDGATLLALAAST